MSGKYRDLRIVAALHTFFGLCFGGGMVAFLIIKVKYAPAEPPDDLLLIAMIPWFGSLLGWGLLWGVVLVMDMFFAPPTALSSFEEGMKGKLTSFVEALLSPIYAVLSCLEKRNRQVAFACATAATSCYFGFFRDSGFALTVMLACDTIFVLFYVFPLKEDEWEERIEKVSKDRSKGPLLEAAYENGWDAGSVVRSRPISSVLAGIAFLAWPFI